MTNTELLYRDRSGDPEAARRANHAPALREALISAGFTTAGLVEVRLATAVPPHRRRQLMQAPDGAFVLDIIENGDVIEVLASPDRRACAIIERDPVAPLVCIRTILEDGMIVDTTARPKHTLQLSAPVGSASGPLGALSRGVARVVHNGPPHWPRENWPDGGYLLVLVDTDDPLRVWQQHRQRLDQLLDRSLRPHTTPTLFSVLSKRTSQLFEDKHHRQLQLGNAIYVVATLLMLGLGYLVIFPALSAVPTSLFGRIIPVLVFAPLIWATVCTVLSRRLAPLLLPRFWKPRWRPVAELLGETRP